MKRPKKKQHIHEKLKTYKNSLANLTKQSKQIITKSILRRKQDKSD